MILVDEAGFVSSKTLLSVLPNISFKGRKQVHITSHVSNCTWLMKVNDIKDKDENPVFHVISQSLKCKAHLKLESTTCPCLNIYCPPYIEVTDHLKTLMNMIVPKGFEAEVAGQSVTESNTKSDTIRPFDTRCLEQLMRNKLSFSDTQPISFYIGFDPTFANGTKSCAGLVSGAALQNGCFAVSVMDMFRSTYRV